MKERPQIYSTSAPDFLVRDTFDSHTVTSLREVGGWGRDPKKYTGRDWGMRSSAI